MQAKWRKVQALGLTDNYCNPQDPTLKHFVQKMAAVSFCPPAFVPTAWLGVQQRHLRLLESMSYSGLLHKHMGEWSVSSEAVELLQDGLPLH